MNNLERLKNVFSKSLIISIDEVNDSLEYQVHPKWSSLGHVALISALEQEFAITMEMDDILDLISYDDALNVLESKGIDFSV